MADEERETREVGDSTYTLSLEDARIPVPTEKKMCLVCMSGDTVGRMFQIRGQRMTIGRDGNCDIITRENGVSREHVRIVVEDDGAPVLEDLESTNGTFINGSRARKCQLVEGDRIQLGSTLVYKFTYTDELEEEFQRRMLDSAVRDGLTKTYNRMYLDERLPEEFQYAKRHHLPLSLLMMDIDHFKSVNDTHGHPVGDLVLQNVATTVKRTIGSSDVLARFGGEEFIVIARRADGDQALILAERIRTAVEGMHTPISTGELGVTLSLGVSTLDGGPYPNVTSMVEAADKALYRAKEGGRNRTEQAVPEDGELSTTR